MDKLLGMRRFGIKKSFGDGLPNWFARLFLPSKPSMQVSLDTLALLYHGLKYLFRYALLVSSPPAGGEET